MLTVQKYFTELFRIWKDAFSDKLFTIKLLLAPGLFFLYSAVTQKLGTYVEMRKGIQLQDKWLYYIPQFDFSVYIFILLYSSLALVIITHLNKPKVIYRIIEMHLLVAIVRQACILLIALEPPAGIIILRDVFLENTVYPRFSPLTKDLFFSGHVASIWLYFLCAYKGWVKKYLLFATLLMTFMILSMRVHYTYDVYGAIFFTSILYFLPSWIRGFSVSESVAAESSK